VFYQWSLDAFTHTHPHTILWCNAIQHSNILYINVCDTITHAIT